MKNISFIVGALAIVCLPASSLIASPIQYSLVGLTYDNLSVSGTVTLDLSNSHPVTDLDVSIPAATDILPNTLPAEFQFSDVFFNETGQVIAHLANDYSFQLNYDTGTLDVIQALFYGGPSGAEVTGNINIYGDPAPYYTLQGTGQLVTPEPASAGMLLLGVAGVAVLTMRRRQLFG